MGNSSSKDKDSKGSSKPSALRNPSASGRSASTAAASSSQPSPALPSPQERLALQLQAHRIPRASRPELPFLGLIRGQDDAAPTSDKPRETRQEKDARKLEKERQARVKERERSLRGEHVDGGYLVTLGTYTGPEDFSKSIVRQLQIERRLAPFWRGLDDHSSSWTEAQLVAVARGLPIPAPDEIPPHMTRTYSEASLNQTAPEASVNHLTVPITSRSHSHDSTSSANLSPAQPTFSSSGPASPTTLVPSPTQLFRGRAKTLASLATGSKSQSPDLTPREIRLPRDPCVNGQPVEAYLYKDASECPICFMYYPPYLNKTRCCDQPICSECFVQIKRPDPHPPEHEQSDQQRPPEEDAEMLVCEVAACPFCVVPEFGVTYDPPSFRRGLAYAKQANGHPLQSPTSAMSSSSSLNTTGRRRTTSLSANAPQVITTDRVRPDWAKKLADARAHALRRSAAATALHNAAYVLGSQGDGQIRGSLAGFRRRRSMFADSPGASGSGTPRGMSEGVILSPYAHMTRFGATHDGEEGGSDLFPARGSSRHNRVDDLEELMMMEAIRLSLAAEEERKRKEDKEARKDAKKKAKEDKKEAKQAEKLAKKGDPNAMSLYQSSTNDSSSDWASTSMARSNSNLGVQPSIPEEEIQGKGKAPAQDFAGFIPLTEPTSTLNTEMQAPDDDGMSYSPTQRSFLESVSEDPQRHLQESRANLQPTSGINIPEPARLSPHARQLSDAASTTSSMNEAPSISSSLRADSNLPSASGSGLDMSTTAQDTSRSGTPPLEPMLNFRSLTAMIEDEDKASDGEHIEDTASRAEEDLKEPSPTGSPRISPTHLEGNRSRGDSGESSESSPPPVYEDADEILPAPPISVTTVHDVDSKDIGSIDVLDHGRMQRHEATQ